MKPHNSILHISCHLLAFRSLSQYKKKQNPFSLFPHKKQNPKTSTLTKKLPICELHVSLNVHFSFLSKLVRQTARELVSVGLCILSSDPSYQYKKNRRQISVFCWVSRLLPSPYLLLSCGLEVMVFSRLRLLSEIVQ